MRFLRKFMHFWFGGLAEKCGTPYVIGAVVTGLLAHAYLGSWTPALGMFFSILALGYILKKVK